MRGTIAGRGGTRRLLAVVVVLAAAAAALAFGLPGGAGPSRAAGQGAQAAASYQTDASVPAQSVMMFGASPAEAPGETWGIGRGGSSEAVSYVIVRYTSSGGWTREPAIEDTTGAPLSGFRPVEDVLAGQMAPNGTGAVAGFVANTKVIVAREPGAAFQELPQPEASILAPGEALFANHGAPLMAPLEEGGGGGLLLAPVGGSEAEPVVLHWAGAAQQWTREKVELPAGTSQFQAVALGASSSSNAWLLARVSGGVALFRREAGGEGTAIWKPVAPGPSQEPGAPLSASGEPLELEGTGSGQALTVTSQGLWIDGERSGTTGGVTVFFQPSGEGDSGEVLSTWCNATTGSPCQHTLPEPLPTGPYRSYAWADSATPYGERVITGYSNGAVLRLEQAGCTSAASCELRRVPTIGGPGIGATLGAAFSAPLEGWLGSQQIPVHVTTSPQPARLSSWPVPFHQPLLALAPAPGVPVGALTSEAVSVGERGEVARYVPGEGWQPESLLNEAGRRMTPQLRAVAWPRPNRIYAVGFEPEQHTSSMWLWRGETGLWEPDAAMPVNLRANLLGVAFDPNNPSRGYVVGQEGTLLSFGKTWTQEANLPAAAAGASFTSIAFAGSEALVAYRLPHYANGSLSYTGGVLANDGSGWHVDAEVAAGLPPGYIPWAVAGLPDGGAALSAEAPSSSSRDPLVLERGEAGGSWLPSAQPYPGAGLEAPGTLALFREGGALRVAGAGRIPDTANVDSETPAQPGHPPNLVEPYPAAVAPQAGIIRQTASGWNDEQHERNIIGPPPGGYANWDIPYEPDGVAAVLLDEAGNAGWSVGGNSSLESSQAAAAATTSDIARYPADGSVPPGVARVPIETEAATGPQATFAVGGGSQCAAPCADLRNTAHAVGASSGIGPDAWLSAALEEASSVHELRAFLYTGPRVTSGKTEVKETIPVPYERELGRYAELLSGSARPVFAAAAASDRDQGSLCQFKSAFSHFQAPFGQEGLELAGFTPAGPIPSSREPCESGQAGYYAFSSSGGGGTVRVLVLDDSGGVGPEQLNWLSQQLAAARRVGEAAIVAGAANLPEEVEKHVEAARVASETMVIGGASAYLFDDPEANVRAELRCSSCGRAMPAFGSGTLGYMNATASQQSDFVGAAGFLLVRVNTAASTGSNIKPVTATLIPAIGELSLDAEGGTLLRRSQAARFAALARRPRSGGLAPSSTSSVSESANYIPIPSECVGTACALGILPEYTFSSSSPDKGNFVKPNLASGEANAVLLNAQGEPEPDPKSGLFCAFNAGSTTVTITAGGLSASLPVKIEAGSVRRPCGTVPLKSPPPQESTVVPPLQPLESTPASTPSSAPPPVVPLPPPPAAVVAPPARPAAHPATPLQPFIPLATQAALIIPFLPPPLPAPAEPTPPSGTSAVTSPVEAAQKEEEEEEAPDSVSASAVAYHPSENEPAPEYLLGLIVLAAFAGATIRRQGRRGRRDVPIAPATISTQRSQRRLGRRGGRW